VAIQYQPLVSRFAFVLACLCAVSVLLYSIFLLEAVAHAASQTTAQRQIREISAHLGDLEAQYLNRSQTLTLERAEALGYVLPTSVSTVFAEAASSLSFSGH
jgi:hypothetical protein